MSFPHGSQHFVTVKVLKVIAALLVLGGVIGGVAIYSSADTTGYRINRKTYENLPTNRFAKADYEAAAVVHNAVVNTALTVGISGALSGILAFALGSVLENVLSVRLEVLDLKRQLSSAAGKP